MSENTTEHQETSGGSIADLVQEVGRIVAEEEQQLEQIKEMERTAMSRAKDFRAEQLEAVAAKIERGAEGLRVGCPERIADAETALVYHFGGELARHPEWSESFLALENRIKAEAEKQNVVPVLLRYPITYHDNWDDPGTTQVTDSLILVPAEYADSESGNSALFSATFSQQTTSEHAFTMKQIPVNRSAIALRGACATIYGGITQTTADSIGTDKTISRYCLRTDGYSGFSMGNYSYNDSRECCLFETGGYASETHDRGYRQCVGWNEIGAFLKRNVPGRDLETVVGNLYETLEEMEFTDFTGIRSPLVTVLRRIKEAKRQVASLERSVKDGLSGL